MRVFGIENFVTGNKTWNLKELKPLETGKKIGQMFKKT